MSKQLSVASTFSVLALCALALFAPSRVDVSGPNATGATIELAAPAFLAQLTLIY
jgi:hypothetical protein